ncbi:hypothetical protein [Streptomyces atroolivaceus]|uniref:hypothetical protein n=1 Tax=Streptomyces atroolivaceus TaxID=66869 RepID=UPI00378A609B
MERILRGWDRAVGTGLMGSGTGTKYHFTPDGEVLSPAVGRRERVPAAGFCAVPRRPKRRSAHATNTRLPADPLASPEVIEDLAGLVKVLVHPKTTRSK